ncbi:hypothetical protein [Flavobacterium sp.]|uniref:hypothetical protein n=1 Tax=Flavobacterium sp. TaxID=239 RepID=UPI002D03C4DB|nr:hypothetical protein [Flavobacterium sp.]HSD05715.1 hypothetical protein [Flavobacterium sp.]
MDTERDEYQNLKSDVEEAQNNSQDQPKNTPELDSEIEHTDSNYTDDQNNSNTGYTEKLLEKEFQHEQNKNEEENDIEDDPIVKNGNVVIDELTQKDNNEYENQSDQNDEF